MKSEKNNYYERLSKEAIEILERASDISKSYNHGFLGSEHFLVASLELNSKLRSLFARNGVTGNKIKEKYFDNFLSVVSDGIVIYAGLTPELKDAIRLADISCKSNKLSNKLISELIINEILIKKDSLAFKIVDEMSNGRTNSIIASIVNDIKGQVFERMIKRRDEGSFSDSEESAIEKFCVDLNELCSANKIDDVYGRDKEIDSIIEILGKRKKNTPMLLGEPGVGKTAIVEGFAKRIVDGVVPESLKQSRVLSLNITTLVSGTKYRGEFESRVDTLLSELKSDPNIILFIDEVHNIMSSGVSENSSTGIGDMLKPVLARGEIKCIGATTLKEYKKYIAKDDALSRRFNIVNVDEPSMEETKNVLYKGKIQYENHYNIDIDNDVIDYIVSLGARYITNRKFPDKAFDVLDSACSRFKMKGQTGSLDLKTVSDVVSDMTGIPVTDLSQDRMTKLLSLKDELLKRVIGQDDAVDLVTESIIKGEIGFRDENKPIASFAFLGGTGIGKTELAKGLAKILFGNEDKLIRFDMSEYMEKYSVSKLIGAAPGYVGFGDGGLLTEKVRNNPYSVILFDEIEKADESIMNIMLQILDDGRLTDSEGITVDFKNTVIIMTSNIYSVEDSKKAAVGFSSQFVDNSDIREEASNVLADRFSPEFINRIDEIVVFNTLDKESKIKILDIEFNKILNRVVSKGINIELTENFKDYIISISDVNKFGARPIKRNLSKNIETKLSYLFLVGEVNSGDSIVFDYSDNQVKYSISKKEN